ncbi:hypothetical protein WA026_012986 [Henosepilachna vigintioctopunctata]|uniref:Uncharacterized protein n=1 Tax=Henosepilachna vigintioctopunctata TaxID=420089 RepID=A0AAW1TU31_9CUCU
MSEDTTPHKSVDSGNEEITAKNTVHDRVCEASKSTPKNTTRNTPQIVSKNMTPHKSAVAGSEEITVKDTVRDRVCEAIKSTPKNTTRNTPQIVSKNMTPHESTVSGTEEITAKNTVHDHNCETSNTHVEGRSSSRQLLSVDVNAASRASLEQSHIPIKESTQDESTRNSYTPPVDDLIDGLPSDFYVIDEIVDKSEVEVSVTPPNDVMQIDNDRKTATTENNASSITNSLSDKNDYKELNSKSCSSDVNLNKDLDHKSKSSESQIEPETGAVDSNFDVINFFMTSDVNSLKTYLKAELSVLRKSSFKVKNYYYRLLAYKEDSNKPEHEWKISLVKKQKLYKEINMMLFGREQIKAGRFHYGELAKFVNNASGFITKHFRDSLYSSYEYIFSNTLHRHVNYEQMIEILMRKYSNRTI